MRFNLKQTISPVLMGLLISTTVITMGSEEKQTFQGRVKVDNLHIGYKEKGSGDAIIFLHGVGSDKSVWDRQLDYFSKKWRGVSLDYPGYGDSDLPEGKLNRQEIARYLFGAMDGLGIESAHIVGLSMGGVMALEMACQQPTRLRSITLADTFARHPEAERILERLQKAIATISMRELAKTRVDVLLAPHAPEALKHEVIETMAKIDKRTYAWSSIAVWTADYRSDLPGIKVPTLIIVGEQDQITPYTLSEELHQGIPGSKLEVIPKTGHITNIENPVEFNRLVEEFIVNLD